MMFEKNRSEKIRQMQQLLNQNPTILQTLNQIINNDLLSLLNSLTSESRQSDINNTLSDWAKITDVEINNILDLLNPKYTEITLRNALIDILGLENANKLFREKTMPVMLNPLTFSELEPYYRNQMIRLDSTGALATMGANNRVGDHVEEVKRANGIGSGFILSIL